MDPHQEGREQRSTSAAFASLLDAVAKGDVGHVRRLIGAKAHAAPLVTETDEKGRTVLLRAAAAGSAEAIAELLRHGAAVDAADSDDATAMDLAIVSGFADIVSKLARHGADVNRASTFGETKRTLAARCGPLDVVVRLLELGCALDVTSPGGTTALIAAAGNRHLGVVAELLRGGADVSAKDGSGTALAHAAFNGDLNTVAALLQASYAAATACEARVFVPRDATNVGEWLVRHIAPAGSRRRGDQRPKPSANAPSTPPARRRGLECQLQHELRVGQRERVAESSVEAPPFEAQAASETESPLARLERLYTAIPRLASSGDPDETREKLHAGRAAAGCAHLSVLRGVCELDAGNGGLLAVFEYEKHSLLDVLKHNRHVLHADGDGDAQGEELALSDLKRRFLVYQLHRVLQFLHARGLACGGFGPSDVLLTDTLWVRLGTLPIAGRSDGWEEEEGAAAAPASCRWEATVKRDARQGDRLCRSVSSLDSRSITERWCEGDVSNFEYLMLLNAAAGRRMVDSVFHPFLPWVSGFRSRDAGWRDLTKSKFRLNKGDDQLDRTLSEITYYIYMARRTPMEVLRQVVRSNFQPKEYPSSLARMYDWTPDECIPEFYTEPSVFTSLRSDAMEDLALPPWCADAHDFIRSHRAMLEGDAVSQQLHHWIDLNFGVSLSGAEAIRHKNVPLKAPREARLGKSPGFVQVFQHPHPARRRPRRVPDTEAPEPSVSIQQQRDQLTDATDLAHRVHFSFAASYRPNESKANVNEMLSKALRIVSDAGDGAWASGVEPSARVLQSRHSMTSLSIAQQSVALAADAKSQSLTSRAKAKRKPKPRPRSHGSEPPPTPPSSAKDDSTKSPTVSRLATVIPNFFHPDSSFGHSSGSSGGLASSFKLGGDATPKATTPVAGSGSRPGSQFADGALAENGRIPAPLIHSVAGDTGVPHHTRGASTGAAGTSPGTSTAHIFRELWQQLSKPDEGDADYAGESSGLHLLDGDWDDADFERLDETDLQLLGVGLPIKMTGDNGRRERDKSPVVATETLSLAESSEGPEARARLRRTSEASIDPVYSLPREGVAKAFPDSTSLSAFELRKADDLFALGCVVAELYTLSPLFSRRCVSEFIAMLDRDAPTSSRHEYWGSDITASLDKLPGNVKNAVLALVHPNPRERLLLAGVLDGDDAFSFVASFERESSSGLSAAQHPILALGFSPAQTTLFPTEFALVYRFLAHVHRLADWTDRFAAARLFLPSLAQLSPLLFRVVLPVLAQFFQPASHMEPIHAERVAAAVVFLLPPLGAQLGRLGARQELLQDVLRVYESAELSPLLKLCLAAPEVLKHVMGCFGMTVFIESFLPVLVDWTVSAQAALGADDAVPRALLFAPEANAIVTTALGELSSAEGLGPSLAAKYVLAALLPHLGKLKSKWAKLATPTTVLQRTGSHDGLHVTFLRKSSLYEPHYVADALLVVCREVGDFPVRHQLLPHVFDVLPQLVLLAEKIGSVRVEGVPDDLGREVYVTLRVLRHIVRNLSDAAVQSELLDRKGGTSLVDLLDAVEPPFLHPRTAAALAAAATTSSALADGAAKRSILRSLCYLKAENRRSLRAFTVVGLARTLVAVCQKLGPDATAGATALVQAVNRFLARCGAVYSELEVSNFQWPVASEVVSELCGPLRNLLGRDAFATLFPVVSASSVLQLLLLPIGGIDRNSLGAASAGPPLVGDKECDNPDPTTATTTPTMTLLRAVEQCPPDLLHFAYRATRMNAIKAPSFQQLPRSRLSPSSLQDLGEDVARVQEVRRRRQTVLSSALSLASPAQRFAADNAWLRPLARRAFASEPLAPTGDAGGSAASAAGFLESWAFASELLHSIKAHSSSVRCVSVDPDEEVLLSGSKSGSCRAWRLAGHPCHAQAAVHATGPVLAVQSALDGAIALALEASCVYVWDVRTSHVRVKLPFAADDSAVALALLRAPAARSLSAATSAPLGSADFAVATARNVVCVDLRAGPRVVADWRVDARDAVRVTALATVFTAADAFLAAGTAGGAVVLVDRRSGRLAARWAALDARVVKLAQLSRSLLLVVGADREARVWDIARLEAPRAQALVLGVPEGVRESQLAVQAFADAPVLYAASASKLLAVRLPTESDTAVATAPPPTVRMDVWPLLEPTALSSSSSSSLSVKLSRSKVVAQSVCVLPLRRVLVLGSDDGFLKCVV
ncbi:hypothetical protein PybrP1_005861 [[Pythium] brassicae (nom. inval.)]|nr:hypothetical protein PybrP1_005861 [[Pythium] brassicae (nom. inval.)]